MIPVFGFSLLSTSPSTTSASFISCCLRKLQRGMLFWATPPICKADCTLPKRTILISSPWARFTCYSLVLHNLLYLVSHYLGILYLSYLPVFPSKLFESSYFIFFFISWSSRSNSISVCWWTNKCFAEVSQYYFSYGGYRHYHICNSSDKNRWVVLNGRGCIIFISVPLYVAENLGHGRCSIKAHRINGQILAFHVRNLYNKPIQNVIIIMPFRYLLY